MILNLPLAASKDEIEKRLKEQKHLLLTAPTGTGKSSFLPYLLAGKNKKIIVLQPRQLAAKELAKFLASAYNESVGNRVGYKFRFENKSCGNTQILFQTYGSFLAEITHNKKHLTNIDWIIFDEFHERKAEMDLLLAVVLSEGKRVAVLSAELERESLERYLGVKCLKIESKNFPVEIIHQEPKIGEALASQVERAVKSILLNNINGTILVFLPGKAEISICKERVEESLGKNSAQFYSLFGGQLKEEQEKIFEQSEDLRIIFTTNIAETSLTIPGVKAVIDSGFERIMFNDLVSGLKTLRLSRIAMQNAIQRTGRAGRTQKGLCIRLWSEREGTNFSKAIKPEIERINLDPFVLQKMSFNLNTALLTELPKQKEQIALEKLENLNLIKENKITALGKEVLNIPVQNLELATALAAMLTEQKKISKEILALVIILESGNKSGNILHLAEDFLKGKGKFIREDKLHFEQLFKYIESNNKNAVHEQQEIKFLLGAFPKALAFKSSGEQYYKTKDNIAVFCECKERAILVLSVMRNENNKLQKTSASLYAIVPENLLPSAEFRFELQWKSSQKQFVAMRVSDYDRVECSTEERKQLENSTASAWQTLMQKENFASAWQTETNLNLLAKMKLAAKIFPEHNFPTWNEEDISLIMEEFCSRVFLLKDLNEERYRKIIEDYFGSHWLEWLNKSFPSSLKLANNRIAKYLYNNENNIVELSARIGDFIGMQGEHFIAENRLRVRYDILAPNYRTVQKTYNLTDFWQNTYPQIRKELKGRYPKHPWPL